MTRSRIIIAIRVCLLVLVGLVLSLPWWWFLLSLMIPVFSTGTPCAFCDSGTTPTQIQVDITGMADDICSDCTDFNTTFILDQNPAILAGCYYYKTYDASICSFTLMELKFVSGFTTIFLDGTAETTFFQEAASDPRDCSATDSISPLTSATNCDGSAATASYTPIAPFS